MDGLLKAEEHLRLALKRKRLSVERRTFSIKSAPPVQQRLASLAASRRPNRRFHASQKIQSLYRGRMARNRVKTMLEAKAKEEQINAKIQKKRRTMKNRKKRAGFDDQITIFVHINECSFPVCCNWGGQSMRWLALCAAKRYASEYPSGRIRQREVFHSCLRDIAPEKSRGRRPVTAGLRDTVKLLPWNPVKFDYTHHHPRNCMGRVSCHGLFENGKTLRRLANVGGVLKRGNLSPIRLKLPHKKEDEEEALLRTYDRTEHGAAGHMIKLENAQAIMAQTAPPLGRNENLQHSKSTAFESLRPRTVGLRERRSRNDDKTMNRPSTAGARVSSTPACKSYMFSTESEEYDPEDCFQSKYFAPFDSIKETLQTGDHVWIKVDLRGGAFVERVASLGEHIDNTASMNVLMVDGWEDSFVLNGFIQGRFSTKDSFLDEKKKKQSPTIAAKPTKTSKKRVVFGLRRGEHIKRTVEILVNNDIERSKIASVIPDQATAKKVGQLLSKNYLRIESLFRHFAFLLPGNSFTMGASEFLMMCKACKITSKKCDQSTQGRIFIAANVTKRVGKDGKQKLGKTDDDGGKNEAVMYEFLEAVVRLGLTRYRSEFNNDIYNQLEFFISNHLAPVADRIMTEWEKPLEYLNNPDVQNMLTGNGRLGDLKIGYFAFAMYDRYDGPQRAKSVQLSIPQNRRGLKAELSMEDWIEFMNETNLIDNEKITLQKGQESFVAAQMHSRIHSKVSKNKLKSEEGSFALMDFGEFLEALAQIAYRKFSDSSEPFHDKMKKIICLVQSYFEPLKQTAWVRKAKKTVPKVNFGLDIHDTFESVANETLDATDMGAMDMIDETLADLMVV
jgi:hypothetical protein